MDACLHPWGILYSTNIPRAHLLGNAHHTDTPAATSHPVNNRQCLLSRLIAGARAGWIRRNSRGSGAGPSSHMPQNALVDQGLGGMTKPPSLWHPLVSKHNRIDNVSRRLYQGGKDVQGWLAAGRRIYLGDSCLGGLFVDQHRGGTSRRRCKWEQGAVGCAATPPPPPPLRTDPSPDGERESPTDIETHAGALTHTTTPGTCVPAVSTS